MRKQPNNVKHCMYPCRDRPRRLMHAVKFDNVVGQHSIDSIPRPLLQLRLTMTTVLHEDLPMTIMHMEQ